MKIINSVIMMVGMFASLVNAAPPENTYVGVKNDSDQLIHAMFIDSTEFPKIFKAQGWNSKAADFALNVADKAINLSERTSEMLSVYSEYKREKETLKSLKKQLLELKPGTVDASRRAILEKKINDSESKISKLRGKDFEQAKKIGKVTKVTEKWIDFGKTALSSLSETLGTVLPDIVVASIGAKSFAEQLYPKQSKTWTKENSKLSRARDITFAVFGDDPKYKHLPDFTNLLFVRTIDPVKYNFVQYNGKGTAQFIKYGPDETGKYGKLASREKIYPPMYVSAKKGATATVDPEGAAAINRLLNEEQAVEKAMQKDIEQDAKERLEQEKHEAELAQKEAEQAAKELLEKEKLEAEQAKKAEEAKLKPEEGKKAEEGQQQKMGLEKVGEAPAGTTTPTNK